MSEYQRAVEQMAPKRSHALDTSVSWDHRPFGGNLNPHSHLILEAWSHDKKQLLGAHIDEYHPPDKDGAPERG